MSGKLRWIMLFMFTISVFASSAHAGLVEPQPVSDVEHQALLYQESQVAPLIQDVRAGDGGTEVMAAVGVVLLVLILVGAAASGG